MRNVRFVLRRLGDGELEDWLGRAGYEQLPNRLGRHFIRRADGPARYHAIVDVVGRHRQNQTADYRVRVHRDSEPHVTTTKHGRHLVYDEVAKMHRRVAKSPG